MDHQIIPTTYYVPAKTLVEKGLNYSELKLASLHGGILKRWRSRKTRRVFYRSKNLELF